MYRSPVAKNAQRPLPLSDHDATLGMSRWPPRREAGTGITSDNPRGTALHRPIPGASAGPPASHSLQTLEGNCMPELGCGSVQLLNVDPELAASSIPGGPARPPSGSTPA